MLVKLKLSATNTHVQLKVDYWKNRKAIFLTIAPVQLDGDFIIQVFGTAENVQVEETTRLNRKRVQAIANEVASQVKAKQGRFWTLLTDFLTKHNLELSNQSP